MEGVAGDTVAATLYGYGVRAFTKSRKFHQARGLTGTFTAGHLATVDGIPHCRLDRVPAKPNQRVQMENVWPSAGFDLLSFARLLPKKMLRAGFEHPRYIPDGTFAWRLWEKFLWHMAGAVNAPDNEYGSEIAGQQIETDVLVIGGGPEGVAAAIAESGNVVLVNRSPDIGGVAYGMKDQSSLLPDNVTVLTNHEVYGLFDNASIAMAASNDPNHPGVQIIAERIILATGIQSVPPLVQGAVLPGVLDARTALHLAQKHGVSPGKRTVAIGTPRGQSIAERLSELECNVIEWVDAENVVRIEGHDSVSAVQTDAGRIACDSVVHAGPWRVDHSLAFQASANGYLRLVGGDLPAHASQVGACAEASEDISFGRVLNRSAFVCPCMDVRVDEILDLIDSGITHVEELKRRSTCGMGTCQGIPCWDYLAAVVAYATGQSLEDIGHPTYRPPRGALTVGQAAGLADITEIEE